MKYENYDEFERYFIFGEKDRQSFFNWLTEKEFQFEQEDLENDIEILENRLLAEIAGTIWGKEFAYHKRLQMDKQVLTALDNIEQAKQILQ